MIKLWPKVKLGEVLRLDLDRVTVDASLSYPMVGVLSFGRGLFDREPIENGKTSYRFFYRLKTDHIVMSQLFGWEGALALSSSIFAGKFLSPQFPTFLCNELKLDRAFMGWLMQRPLFWEDLGSRASGMGDRRRTLNPEALFACEIPLPPLSEQRRIVARIEELAAQIHEARSLRLQAAEDALALLTAARRAAISKCQAPTVALESACAAIIDNLHSNPCLSESGIPCIRSPDVGYGTLDLDGAQRTDEQEFRRRTVRGEPQPNDIVLVREGGGTGKCAIVQPDQRFSLGQRVMMLRPNIERVLPRFFLHQLLSPQIQEEQIAPLSKGSASPHLNIGALREFSLILPTIEEQRRIVAELDALQAQVDALKRLQAETATELDALLPAILDRAFKGEL